MNVNETAEKVKTARQRNGLSQVELARKINVSQGTVSNWESGRGTPDEKQISLLESILGGELTSSEHIATSVDDQSAISAWLSRARQKAGLTYSELADKAGVSIPTIFNIEKGKSENPRPKTLKLLESALGEKLEDELRRELKESSQVEGLGEFSDFNPRDEKERPDEPGIYVLYDISERPIYVGKAKAISDRIKDHSSRNWFPIVHSAAYVRIDDERLRGQVEKILIKFLKKNAVLNQQHVDRD
ncbi:MAG: helix-turn-helix domain-containing protein [Terriglobia bacterium]